MKRHEASGIARKPNDVSGSVIEHQEVFGSVRKGQKAELRIGKCS